MTFKFVKPAKARPFDKKRDSELLTKPMGSNVIAEIKRNGWRMYGSKESCYTSTNHKENIPWIQAAIPEGYVFDGEVCFDDFTKSSGDITHALSNGLYEGVSYYIFDVFMTPKYSQEEVARMNLKERKELINQFFAETELPESIKLNEVFTGTVTELVAKLKLLKAEGLIFKYLDRVNSPGGRANMIKFKFTETYDVIITSANAYPSKWRVRPGAQGSDGKIYPDGVLTDPWLAGYRGLMYGWKDVKTGQIVEVGSLGVTGKQELLIQHVGKVGEVKAWGLFPSGALQHPQLQNYRDPKDKAPESCLFDFEKGIAA